MRTNLATDALPSLFASSLYSIFLGRAVGELALAGLGYASPVQLFGSGSASVQSKRATS
jgi:hypothetical protein